MSRFIAGSVTADWIARLFNLALFLVLLPLVLILSRRPGGEGAKRDGVAWPDSARSRGGP